MLVPTRSPRKRSQRRAWPSLEELGARDLPSFLLTVVVEPTVTIAIVSEVNTPNFHADSHAFQASSRFDSPASAAQSDPSTTTPSSTSSMTPGSNSSFLTSSPATSPFSGTFLSSPSSPLTTQPTTTATTTPTGTALANTGTSSSATTNGTTQSTSNTSSPTTTPLGVAVLGNSNVSNNAPAVAQPTAPTTNVTPPASVNNPFIQTVGPASSATTRLGEVQLLPANDPASLHRAIQPSTPLNDAFHGAGGGGVTEEMRDRRPVVPAADGPALPPAPMELAPADDSLPDVFSSADGKNDDLFEESNTVYAGIGWGRDIAAVLTPLAFGLVVARVDRGRKRKDGKDEDEKPEE